MKKFILALLAAAFIAPSLSAQVYVRGYTRSDGTYVAPHYRSSPNSTTLDNYSTRGNVNPYTGRVGTRDPYAQPRSNPYGTYSNPYARPRTTTPCYYDCPD
jgi:opacity protein-like surface antigen